MSFASDIEAEVKRIFREQWEKTGAINVPEPSDIPLEKNSAKEISDATILYADLSGSTDMVRNYAPHFAAEIYRAYLYSAAQIIRNEGGVVTAYDGDRVMAVYLGKTPNTDAATTALKINYAVKNIINPAIVSHYGARITYVVKQVVGIDCSSLWVARTGVRGDNDLVWVGRAANYAAKLTDISNDDASFITGEVFDRLADAAKYSNTRAPMWRERKWSQMNDMRIYSSNWTWTI